MKITYTMNECRNKTYVIVSPTFLRTGANKSVVLELRASKKQTYTKHFFIEIGFIAFSPHKDLNTISAYCAVKRKIYQKIKKVTVPLFWLISHSGRTLHLLRRPLEQLSWTFSWCPSSSFSSSSLPFPVPPPC
jgi:hypothetical protein